MILHQFIYPLPVLASSREKRSENNKFPDISFLYKSVFISDILNIYVFWKLQLIKQA